ncbi:hypothetical protein D3C85_1646140 [compost metagenome]
MNTRMLLLASTLACTAFTGLAQAYDTSTSTTSNATPYHYGMTLSVGKVVSLTEPITDECKVVIADMKYIDKSGKPQELSYRKLSDACNFYYN